MYELPFFIIWILKEHIMQKLHYQEAGQGEAIILIHGLFGSLENLGMIAKALKEHYRVISVDVRNHGQSFHKNNMTYSELSQDIINVMDELNISSAYILGHSMGGKIAMQLAINYPDRVKKLIVADIAPIAYPPHHERIINGLKSLNLKSISTRKEADKQLEAYVETPSVRQFLLRNLSSNNGVFHFKCNLNNIADCYPQIMSGSLLDKQYTGQVLFIKGGDSDYIQTKHRDTIKMLFPKSTAKIIQGTGHWLHAEKPAVFNKIVHDFLIKA